MCISNTIYCLGDVMLHLNLIINKWAEKIVILQEKSELLDGLHCETGR